MASGLAWPLLCEGDMAVEDEAASADAGMRDDQQGVDADDAEARSQVWMWILLL